MTSSSYQILLKNLELEQHKQGSCVTKCGHKGHKFFVICKGVCSILVPRGDSRKNIVPQRYLEKFDALNMFDINESDEENEISHEDLSDDDKIKEQIEKNDKKNVKDESAKNS